MSREEIVEQLKSWNRYRDTALRVVGSGDLDLEGLDRVIEVARGIPLEPEAIAKCIRSFYAEYKRLAKLGECDSPGGHEFMRVRWDWFSAGCPENIEQFIRDLA